MKTVLHKVCDFALSLTTIVVLATLVVFAAGQLGTIGY
jgi:hypothetical protein